MPRASALKSSSFNDDEWKIIARAAHAVWNEIGGDILTAVGEETGKGQGVTISRANVIELVLDASRLEGQLRGTKGVAKEFVERVAKYIYSDRSEVKAYLKKEVFTYSRYGW